MCIYGLQQMKFQRISYIMASHNILKLNFLEYLSTTAEIAEGIESNNTSIIITILHIMVESSTTISGIITTSIGALTGVIFIFIIAMILLLSVILIIGKKKKNSMGIAGLNNIV